MAKFSFIRGSDSTPSDVTITDHSDGVLVEIINNVSAGRGAYCDGDRLVSNGGKYYFEAEIYTGSTNLEWLGFSDNPNEQANFDRFAGNTLFKSFSGITDTLDRYNRSSDGDSSVNTSFGFSSPGTAVGDVFGFAIDLDNGDVFYYHNGILRNPDISSASHKTINATGAGGATGALTKITPWTSGRKAGQKIKFRLAVGDFLYTPPAGFSAYDPFGSGIPGASLDLQAGAIVESPLSGASLNLQAGSFIASSVSFMTGTALNLVGGTIKDFNTLFLNPQLDLQTGRLLDILKGASLNLLGGSFTGSSFNALASPSLNLIAGKLNNFVTGGVLSLLAGRFKGIHKIPQGVYPVTFDVIAKPSDTKLAVKTITGFIDSISEILSFDVNAINVPSNVLENDIEIEIFVNVIYQGNKLKYSWLKAGISEFRESGRQAFRQITFINCRQTNYKKQSADTITVGASSVGGFISVGNRSGIEINGINPIFVFGDSVSVNGQSYKSNRIEFIASANSQKMRILA